MKTLHLSIIAVAGIVSIVTNSINLVSADIVPPPGPPPPVPVTIGADKQVYLAGDTITVSGRVDRTLLQTDAPLFIQFFNSGGIQVHGPDRIYENKDGSYAYHLKLEKTFGDTDHYNILITHDSNTYDAGTAFMFIAGPYNLVASGKTYPIYYTITSGKLDKISVDVNLKSMVVTIVSAPSSFSVELPRDLIDSKSGTSDTNFTVLIGEHNQPQKFMSKAKFDEIRNNSKTRTLLINFPNDVTNPTGTWDVVIAGNRMVNESQIISPLKQFKSGITANEIQCKEGLQLVFKALDGSPACVKSDNAVKLIMWGWAKNIFLSNPCSEVYPDGLDTFQQPFSQTSPKRLVFFMEQNSAAQICVRYTSPFGNTGLQEVYPGMLVRNPTYEQAPASEIIITAEPNYLPLNRGANTTVIYTITSQNNSKGVYWMGISQICELIPVIVGINSLDLSSWDIPVFLGFHSCPSQSLYAKIIGVSNATAEYKIAQPIGEP